jgi:hypothetical protein
MHVPRRIRRKKKVWILKVQRKALVRKLFLIQNRNCLLIGQLGSLLGLQLPKGNQGVSDCLIPLST